MARVCELTNETILLVVEAPGGVYNADQLQLLATLLDEEGLIAKVSEDQRLMISVTNNQIEVIKAKLLEVGLGLRPYREGLHQPVACIGALCRRHDQDALGDSFKLSDTLSGRDMPANSMRIGINGCAESCVPIHTLDISVIGEPTGYRLSLGGKNSQIPEMASFLAEGIPADKLVDLIGKVVDVYEKYAQPEETLNTVIERVGVSPFVEVLAPYSQDAPDESDPFGNLASSASGEFQADELTDIGPSSQDLDDIEVSELEPELLSSINEDTILDAPSNPEDEIAELDDLDVSADRDLERELSDELTVQDNFLEEGLDIDPGAATTGDLDLDVPINADQIANESEFGHELLDIDENQSSDIPARMADEGDEAIMEDDFTSHEEEFVITDEIDEDIESQLEGKIEESIAEQATLGEITDENLEDRNAALELVTEQEKIHEEFDLNSFDQEAALGAELEELEIDYAEESSQLNICAFNQLQGMTFDHGKVRITFASGATLVIDFQRMKELGGRRSFNIDGQQIEVRIEGEDAFIAVDGIEVNLALHIAA